MKSYFLFFTLLLSACHNSPSKDNQYPDYEQIADGITARIAKKIESETGLQLIGTGGGMMDHIRTMAMSFECRMEITLEQGRELLIFCLNEYLAAINANNEVRPYLIHYPFTPKDIQIRIFICKQDRRDVPIGSLAVTAAINGILDYKIKQPGLPSTHRVHKEPYEEAIKILETEGLNNKLRKNAPTYATSIKLKA